MIALAASTDQRYYQKALADSLNPFGTVPPGESPSDPMIGMVLADRYRILRRLGEGGMGVVYEAEHVVIEKRLAVKVLAEDFAKKNDLVQRFMQEARAASRIGHENIVDVTDFGQVPHGSVFIVMEFLDGRDLAHHLKEQGAMSWNIAQPIATQICRALAAAHTKGIVHRDLKPENIFLIEREGRSDFVKVLDFGIAKMSSLDTSQESARLTKTGMIFGTPEYMSPEQASGAKADHRVDIYALGVILYEMVTGTVPFRADTFMGILTKHMFEPPVPPSKCRPDLRIPADVEAVVLKALEKDRDKRFQTMHEFEAAIAQCQGTGRLATPPPHPATGVWSDRQRSETTLEGELLQPRRTRAVAVAGVAGVLVVLAAGGLYFGGTRQPTPSTPTADISAVSQPPTRAVSPPPPASVPAPVTPPPAPVPAPSEVAIAFVSQPPGALVMRGDIAVGVTPVSLTLPATTEKLVYTVRKKGYRDEVIEFVPDHNLSMERTLVRQSMSGQPRARPGAQPVTVPAAAPPPSEPPAPPSKLKDLKDPFGND